MTTIAGDEEKAVRSPCVRICRFEEGDDRCLGCLRTRDEIRGWSQMSEPARRTVVAALPQRMRDRFARRRAERPG